MKKEILGNIYYSIISKNDLVKDETLKELAQYKSIEEISRDDLRTSEYYDYLKGIEIPKDHIIIICKEFYEASHSIVDNICNKIIAFYQKGRNLERLADIVSLYVVRVYKNEIKKEYLKDKKRLGIYTNIRHLIMYEALLTKKVSLREVAGYFNRHHATAVNARTKIGYLIETDRRYRELVNEIERLL